MNAKILVPAMLAGLLAGCGSVHSPGHATHDFLVTGSNPNRLFVINPRTQKVVSDFKIPDAHDYVSVIVPSPDGKVAYVLVNRARSIAGINLRTGKEVFRANLERPGERVTCMYAFDVTPDGKELIVYVNRTRLERDQYKVQTPRFLIFSTTGGLHAKPLREFPAPRRVQMILAAKDGRSFFAIGFNLYEYALSTGRLMERRGILDWHRPHHLHPDMLAFWPVTEPTGIFSSPVYSTLSGPGMPPGGVPETSLLTLNLHDGHLAFHDIGKTNALIFSTVVGPHRRWAYGAYTQLTKIKIGGTHWGVTKQVNLPHTYYSVNISPNGKEVYVGGTMCDVVIYDARTMRKKGDVKLPGCGDQATATLRVIERR